jgi:hypothetical protein
MAGSCVMNHRIPYKAGNSFITRATITFSGSNLFHEINIFIADFSVNGSIIGE